MAYVSGRFAKKTMNILPLETPKVDKLLFDDTVARIVPETESVIDHHRFSDDTSYGVLGAKLCKAMFYINNLVHTSVKVPKITHESVSHDESALSSYQSFPPLTSVGEW
tara:strand:- start:3235 stop:3561 length:327 start_codon:yes stop_codon:yes gene_type:complete